MNIAFVPSLCASILSFSASMLARKGVSLLRDVGLG